MTLRHQLIIMFTLLLLCVFGGSLAISVNNTRAYLGEPCQPPGWGMAPAQRPFRRNNRIFLSGVTPSPTGAPPVLNPLWNKDQSLS